MYKKPKKGRRGQCHIGDGRHRGIVYPSFEPYKAKLHDLIFDDSWKYRAMRSQSTSSFVDVTNGQPIISSVEVDFDDIVYEEDDADEKVPYDTGLQLALIDYGSYMLRKVRVINEDRMLVSKGLFCRTSLQHYVDYLYERTGNLFIKILYSLTYFVMENQVLVLKLKPRVEVYEIVYGAEDRTGCRKLKFKYALLEGLITPLGLKLFYDKGLPIVGSHVVLYDDPIMWIKDDRGHSTLNLIGNVMQQIRLDNKFEKFVDIKDLLRYTEEYIKDYPLKLVIPTCVNVDVAID